MLDRERNARKVKNGTSHGYWNKIGSHGWTQWLPHMSFTSSANALQSRLCRPAAVCVSVGGSSVPFSSSPLRWDLSFGGPAFLVPVSLGSPKAYSLFCELPCLLCGERRTRSFPGRSSVLSRCSRSLVRPLRLPSTSKPPPFSRLIDTYP